MKKIDLWTATQKEADEYIQAAKRSREEVEEIYKKLAEEEKIISAKMTEEEKEIRRQEAKERQRIKKIQQLAEDKVALEYVYQAYKEDFLKAIKMVLKKELATVGKDFIACLYFPYGDKKADNIEIDLSSAMQIYVKIEGEETLRMFALLYKTWRDDYDKFPLSYTLQRNYYPTPITQTSLKSFSSLEDFDENTIAIVY